MPNDLILQIDLNAPVTLAGCARGLRAFWVWWMRELTNALPMHWQANFSETARVPRVVFEEGGWRLENAGERVLTFTPAMAAYDIREEIARNAPLALTRSVDVVLPRSDGLFRRIRLPANAATRLRPIVRLQLDRLSPFRGDDVHFDCYTVADPEIPFDPEPMGTTEILVEVAIMPKRQLIAVEQMLRELGLVPRAFVFEGVPARLSALGLPWTKSAQHRIAVLLAGLLMLVAAVLLGPTMSNNEIDDLKSEIDMTMPQVQHALAERDALSRYQLPAQALSPDRAQVLALILDLTKRLPDTAHIARLAVNGTRVELEGRAPMAVPIKSLLTRSPLLTHTQVDRNASNGSFSAVATLRSHAATGAE